MKGRQSKKSPLSGKIKFAKSKGKKPRLEEVELESGRIEVPEFAILDGNVQTIETETKEAGGKRTIDFIFPYFSDSLVYDPLVEIHTDEEKNDFISRVQDLYDAAQAKNRPLTHSLTRRVFALDLKICPRVTRVFALDLKMRPRVIRVFALDLKICPRGIRVFALGLKMRPRVIRVFALDLKMRPRVTRVFHRST